METAPFDTFFTGNEAGDDKGGALYATDITIKGNSSIFEGNTAGDDGGAIYTDKFNGDVSRVSFIKNVAKKGDGGAIYINDEKWITFSQCIFSNNICEGRIFSKDTPEGRGGAIYLDSQSSHLTLKYNILIFNRAYGEGKTVFNSGYYDEISENYWSTNPSEDNGQLTEWKYWPFSNVNHTDSNPLKIEIEFSENPCVVNTSVDVAAVFYCSDGSQCSGAMYTDYIVFYRVRDAEVENRTDYGNSVHITVTPTEVDSYLISVYLFDEKVTKRLEVIALDKYMEHIMKNTGNGKNNQTNYVASRKNQKSNLASSSNGLSYYRDVVEFLPANVVNQLNTADDPVDDNQSNNNAPVKSINQAKTPLNNNICIG